MSVVTLSIPTETYGRTTEYVSSANGLNFRRKPNLEAEVIKVLSFGTEVTVLRRRRGEDKEWVKIEVDDQKGYVHSDYLQKEDPHGGMTYMGTWRITAYSYTGNPCANGNMPSDGYTVACNSLAFGTQLYIDGVGVRTVEDRGPGWLGSSWADLYMSSYSSCVAWGNQYRDVWIIEDNSDE